VTKLPSSSASILAVAVLYKCELSQSQSISSLFQILNEYPALAAHFSVVLYDNSPQPQSLAPQGTFAVHYFHDAANGGLATAYNFALARAEGEDCGWLLLLDQDTSLTADFLYELLRAAEELQNATEVAAIVPKLLINDHVHSPAIPFLEQMRRQFQSAEPPLGQDVQGVLQKPYSAYNSGSALKVSALRSVGGFPEEFWLDFLDHAVFQALINKGYHVYVLRAMLAHDASYANIGSLPLWRMHNVLLAQTLFVKQNGNFFERLLYRIWLLRHSRNLRRSHKDPRVWKDAVRQALLWKLPRNLRPGVSAPLPR
jgi:GT2 family glycosyltransferase